MKHKLMHEEPDDLAMELKRRSQQNRRRRLSQSGAFPLPVTVVVEGPLSMTLEEFVEQFAQHVQGETEAGWRGDAKTANERVKKYAAAFKKLRAHGDAGRDALAVLLQHPRMDVRSQPRPACSAIARRRPGLFWKRPLAARGSSPSRRRKP